MTTTEPYEQISTQPEEKAEEKTAACADATATSQDAQEKVEAERLLPESSCSALEGAPPLMSEGSASAQEPQHSRTVHPGDELLDLLVTWSRQACTRRTCALGIENHTKEGFGTPFYWLTQGRVVYEPPDTVEPETASPSMWSKKKYALSGSSGVLGYNIGSENRIVVAWKVGFASENRISAHIMKPGPTDQELYDSLMKISRKATDGELEAVEGQYKIVSNLENAGNALLIVKVSELDKE
ncbi:hypothetical protein Pelo_4762 [Pelomyxa schiedti]|nr:hypothetical protein Pelo_4762 [Pelomyxa schiedti]